MNDVDKLADILTAHLSHVTTHGDYGWPENSALSVIDCVLSLNRRYFGFVVPRVEAFAQRHPEATELRHLAGMLNGYDQVGGFCLAELNYNHIEREQVLRGVLKYMLSVQAQYQGQTEWMRLQTWATLVKPGNYVAVHVPGFGLAGFQYMRMLFGAQTTKPDVHIIRFVSRAVGHKVKDVQALELLEAASLKARLPLREIDAAIWQAEQNKTAL